MRLTESDIVEMRRLYAKGKSYREIAVMFQCHHETVRRVLKTCDAVSATAPSRKRARGATGCDTVAFVAPAPEVVRDRERVAPLVAGATNEAQRIMRELNALLTGQQQRLTAVVEAERKFNTLAKGQLGNDPGKRYALAMKMNDDHNAAISGVMRTLEQMGRLTKTLNINVDARSVNVQVDVIEGKVMEQIWPMLCESIS